MPKRLNRSGNYTLQATDTYDANSPAASPGAFSDVTAQDGLLSRSTPTEAHLGALITFTPLLPFRFSGLVVKIKPTYAEGEAPALELWTRDATTLAWTKRRAVPISNLLVGTRTDTGKVFDLLLATPLANVDEVWVTMAPSSPTGTQVNRFISVWVFGDCDQPIPETPCDDCGLGGPDNDPTSGLKPCRDIMKELGADPALCDDPDFDCVETLVSLGYDADEAALICNSGNTTCEQAAAALGLDPAVVCHQKTCEEMAVAMGFDLAVVCRGGRPDCVALARLIGVDPGAICDPPDMPPYPPAGDPPGGGPDTPSGGDPDIPKNKEHPTTPTGDANYYDPETLQPADDPRDEQIQVGGGAGETIEYIAFFHMGQTPGPISMRDYFLANYQLSGSSEIQGEYGTLDEEFDDTASVPDHVGFTFDFTGAATGTVVQVRVRRVTYNAGWNEQVILDGDGSHSTPTLVVDTANGVFATPDPTAGSLTYALVRDGSETTDTFQLKFSPDGGSGDGGTYMVKITATPPSGSITIAGGFY